MSRKQHSSHFQWFSYSFIALLSLSWGSLLFYYLPRARFLDFAVYYEAARKALVGQSVYNQDLYFQFKYSPFVAWCIGQGMTWSSFETVAHFYYILWTFCWFGLLLGTLRFAERWHSPSTKSSWIKTLADAGFLTFLFWNSFRHELHFGQLNIIPLALLLWVYLRPQPRKDWTPAFAAGAALSIAAQVKLYSLVCLPYLLFKRDWKTIFSFVLTTLITNLLFLSLVYPFSFVVSENTAWIRALFHSSSLMMVEVTNVSLMGFIAKLTHSIPLAFWVWVAACFGFVGIQFQIRKKDAWVQLNWALLGIVVLNPLVWSYWGLLLIPFFAWMIGDPKRTLFHKFPPTSGEALLLMASFIGFNAQHATFNRNFVLPLSFLTWMILYCRQIAPTRRPL